MAQVSFSPNARTKWHTHSFEQGLLITDGKGVVATEAQEHLVEPGDIVIVPAGEKHWHGGTETTGMAHISITTPGETTVLEPVDRVKTRA
jgi:quercetin dioxygenase-like cupin family protein